MDYGKLAYVKAEEIERYLRRSKTENSEGAVAAFFPRAALESGYSPCTVEGSGNVSLTVSMLLYAPCGADSVAVTLYCGESAAAYTRITTAAGTEVGVTLLACVYPSGGESIRVQADREGLLLEEIRVLAVGADASLSSGKEGYRADAFGGEIYLCRELGGYVYVSKQSGEEVNVSHGSVYDIAASGEGVDVLCSDDDGNLWGVSYDAELGELARVRLGEGFSSVALGVYGGERLIAAVKDGRIYFALCGERFGGMTDFSEPEGEIAAERVYLSRGTGDSALLFKRGKGLYAKFPAVHVGAKCEVKFNASIEV